jgi:hypothetical protein
MPSSITLKTSGHLDVDVEAITNVVSAAAVGHVKNRMEDGLDNRDKPMKAYSAGYRRWLQKKGEDLKVDHRVTGKMLEQLREMKRERSSDGKLVTVTVGVAPGGNRNLIAAYLQEIRAWLGISPRGQKSIAKLIQATRNAIKNSGGTTTKRL